MSGKPAARVTDSTSCPISGHGNNPIVCGSPNVFFDGLAAARQTDLSECGAAIVGAVSTSVYINGLNAAVQGSTGDHGSIVVGGSGTVIIGDSVAMATTSPVSSMPVTALPMAIALAPTAQPTTLALTAKTQPAPTKLAPTDPITKAVKILDDFEKKPNSERVFNDPAHPMGTPEDPFEKSKVYEQLKVRVAGAHGYPVSSKSLLPSYPEQGETSLCGPATFFYALLMDRPDLYTQAIIDLWEKGETSIGQLHIKPSHAACNPKNLSTDKENDRIWAIDWISLASLRDSENTWFDYDSPDKEIAGITLPSKLRDWFKLTGSSVLFDNVHFTSHINKDQFIALFQHLTPQSHVATLIGAGMLERGSGLMKNHWITWEQGPTTTTGIVTSQTPLNENIIGSKLFSWGELKHQVSHAATLESVLKYMYGGLVFSKIP